MKSIHSKAFPDVWRALSYENSPDPTVDHWQCDGVDWIHHIDRIGTRDYAFLADTHILTCPAEGSHSWALFVVVERSFRPGGQEALRFSMWRQVPAGRNKQVPDWFDRQPAGLEART